MKEKEREDSKERERVLKEKKEEGRGIEIKWARGKKREDRGKRECCGDGEEKDWMRGRR